MEIIALTKENWKQTIKEAVIVLLSGGVVAYPTETSYGLGADGTNKRAVRKVFRIKDRQKTKLISVLVENKAMARQYAKLTDVARRLWDAFLPGPLTIVIPGRWGGKIGIRVSSHPFVKELMKAFGRPLTTTSANISGNPSLFNVEEILATFSERRYKPTLVIDAGTLFENPPSTVVDCTGKSVRILREGPITLAQIKKVLS